MLPRKPSVTHNTCIYSHETFYDVHKVYKASIAYYTVVIAPLAVGLEINDTQATAFQTKVKETFDSFMSESWRYIATNAKTTKER